MSQFSVEKTGEDIVDLALDTIKRNKQALIFVNSKKSAEATAEKIYKKCKEDSATQALSEELLTVLARPTKQCERVAKLAKRAVVFHHAGLHAKQRELIEDAFREGTIKMICATPTLSAGLDLPAFRSIIKDLKRYDGNWGMQWIPVLEYLQMAGRAGRPGKEEYGEAIILAATEHEKEKVYDKYICGAPEDIYSKLAVEPVLRTYVLSLIASEFVNTEKELFAFFEKTYWAHQYKDMDRLKEIILRMVGFLEECEFITTNGEAFRSADEENDTITATKLGKRVAELYLDPLTAYNLLEGMRKITKKTTGFAVLQLISAQLELRPALHVKTTDRTKIQEKLAEEEFLMQEPDVYDSAYDEFLESIKTARFFEDWISEKDEEYLLEEYSIRPGEIKVKVDNAGWLLYSVEELAKTINYNHLLKPIARIRFRVEEGVKEELLTLLQLRDIGRIRARRLYDNHIKDLKTIRETDVETLAKILGKKIALSVKQQVGQKIDETTEEKKQKQSKLLDY